MMFMQWVIGAGNLLAGSILLFMDDYIAATACFVTGVVIMCGILAEQEGK